MARIDKYWRRAAAGLLAAIMLMLGISFYQLIVASQKEQQQKSLLLLQKEYEKQLEEYIKISDNEQIYRELRHDLMNYIISNQESEKE